MAQVQASLIIPTRNRWAHLLQTLRCLQEQTATGEFEVIVAEDGSDQPPPPEITGDRWPMPVHLLRLGRVGIGPAKNRAIEQAQGPLLIFINDDTYPHPDFVHQHLTAWRDSQGQNLMHLGLTEWPDWPDKNLFDCLIAESGMIFFYHNLQPRQLYNFRHAWNCNLSIDTAAVRAVGGFNERLGPFFFEDLELGFRLQQQGWRVRCWPEALVRHDHRYSPEQYLEREHLLGRMAVCLWRANPDCFRAIYAADLDEAYLHYCRRFVAEQAAAAENFAPQFRQWHRWPPAILDAGPHGRDALVQMFVEAHRILKRYTFRQGLLQEADRPSPPAPPA